MLENAYKYIKIIEGAECKFFDIEDETSKNILSNSNALRKSREHRLEEKYEIKREDLTNLNPLGILKFPKGTLEVI